VTEEDGERGKASIGRLAQNLELEKEDAGDQEIKGVTAEERG